MSATRTADRRAVETMPPVVTLKTNIPTPVGHHIQIAASNIWEEDYRAADGSGARGIRAHLWIRHGDVTHRKLRVHPGQEIEVPGGVLRVVAIAPAGVDVELVER